MESGNRPLAVHHYYPVASVNIGDQLVARALRASIEKHFGPAAFVDVPVYHRYQGDLQIGLLGDNVDRASADADLVVVGGSSLLEPRKPKHFFSKPDSAPDWGVVTNVASIRRLHAPLMLVGMGTGSGFGKPIRRYSPRARDEIQLLHSRAFATAVRDNETVSRLAQIGVRTECIGCPVTFLTDRRVTAGDPQMPLIVAFPPSRIVRRFGGKRFMAQSMRFIEWLHKSKVRLVVAVHEVADLDIVHHWLPSGTEIFYTRDVDELIARYDHCRGVIGFRLHASLLGMGLGKPVVMVGVDWRSLAAIQTFDLQHDSIRAFRPAQFLKLRNLTNLLLAGDSGLIGRQDLGKARIRARYEAFFREASRRLKCVRREQDRSQWAPRPAMLRLQAAGGFER